MGFRGRDGDVDGHVDGAACILTSGLGYSLRVGNKRSNPL